VAEALRAPARATACTQTLPGRARFSRPESAPARQSVMHPIRPSKRKPIVRFAAVEAVCRRQRARRLHLFRHKSKHGEGVQSACPIKLHGTNQSIGEGVQSACPTAQIKALARASRVPAP
jgi:hypothetical protein